MIFYIYGTLFYEMDDLQAVHILKYSKQNHCTTGCLNLNYISFYNCHFILKGSEGGYGHQPYCGLYRRLIKEFFS